MSNPWLPPYLGTWEELISSLLHNPFLGSGQGRGFPYAVDAPVYDRDPLPMRRAEPNPSTYSPAVCLLMSAINMKEIATKMPDGQLRHDLDKRAGQTISTLIEDICGTPPGRIPLPWPGPPPWIYPIVSELAIVANSFPEGSLRNEVLQVAGQIVQRAFGSSSAGHLHQE